MSTIELLPENWRDKGTEWYKMKMEHDNQILSNQLNHTDTMAVINRGIHFVNEKLLDYDTILIIRLTDKEFNPWIDTVIPKIQSVFDIEITKINDDENVSLNVIKFIGYKGGKPFFINT